MGNCGRNHKNSAEVIRDKEDRAIIRIHLNNKGSNAYRPAEFGNEIIIERHIVRGKSTK